MVDRARWGKWFGGEDVDMATDSPPQESENQTSLPLDKEGKKPLSSESKRVGFLAKYDGECLFGISLVCVFLAGFSVYSPDNFKAADKTLMFLALSFGVDNPASNHQIKI